MDQDDHSLIIAACVYWAENSEHGLIDSVGEDGCPMTNVGHDRLLLAFPQVDRGEPSFLPFTSHFLLFNSL